MARLLALHERRAAPSLARLSCLALRFQLRGPPSGWRRVHAVGSHQSTSGVAERKITLCVMPHALIGTRRSQAFKLPTPSSFRLFPAMAASRLDADFRDVYLMRSTCSPHQRQDNPVRIEHQVIGHYVRWWVVFAEAVMGRPGVN